jgi:hypothetical protein
MVRRRRSLTALQSLDHVAVKDRDGRGTDDQSTNSGSNGSLGFVTAGRPRASYGFLR